MRNRKAFTLIELILVLAILVIVGGLSAPFAYRSFAGQKLKKAADLVRAELNRARVEAMRTGQIHGFFYYPGAQDYKVAPFDAEMVQVLNQTRRPQSGVQYREFGDDRLPKGITFAEGKVETDDRALATGAPASRPRGVRPVLFYPDGTSQSARLYVKSDVDDYVAITLRGMTGTASSRTLDHNNELPRAR